MAVLTKTKLDTCARGLTCALALAGALALVGCGPNTTAVASAASAQGEAATALPTITVTANSEIKVVPDKAKIGVAVTTQAATAEATQSANTDGINAVIDALKQLGIDEKSIQTTDTYLNPRYDYSAATYTAPAAPLEEETVATTGAAEIAVEDAASTNIVGYEMTTRLSVSDLEIDQVGEVLQACVAAGATNSDGIQYYSSEYDAKYAEALAAAVEDARAKAEVLASAAGVNLGGVFSITEGYQNTAYRYDTAMASDAVAEGASMKVMPGELDVTANVTVSYEIG